MAEKKAEKKVEPEAVQPQPGDLPEVSEGQSVDGADRPPREQTDGNVKPSSGASDVGLATHDAEGGEAATEGTIGVNPAVVLSGVPPEQTKASLREHHTADALEPGTNAEFVPGFEARIHGHGPDAQHRFTGSHDEDIDSDDHNWMTANAPAEVCMCGAVRLATAAPVH